MARSERLATAADPRQGLANEAGDAFIDRATVPGRALGYWPFDVLKATANSLHVRLPILWELDGARSHPDQYFFVDRADKLRVRPEVHHPRPVLEAQVES